MQHMTSQATYQCHGVHYELFVGNDARAAIVVKDADCGLLYACRGGDEGAIRKTWNETVEKLIALDVVAKNTVVIQ